MPQTSTRALFAARLVQARLLRGLSQRALGDRMGLGKEKGSSRINRYERQVTAISFESLDKLANSLDVPMAYLLADTPEMADGILALSHADKAYLDDLVLALRGLSADRALVAALLGILKLPKREQQRVRTAIKRLISGQDT